MSDLRQRLTEAMSGEIKATMANGEWSVSVGNMPDAALRVFAEWLRGRAEKLPPAVWPIALELLADEIDPR